MGLEPWYDEGEELVADMDIFDVRRLQTRSPRTGKTRRITRIESGDWVNVVALNASGEVVLVRQYRHGTREFTLEIPGGLVEKGESPGKTAIRELREETGWEGSSAVHIGTVTPNPAFMSNRCHTWLVEGCEEVGALLQDDGEDIEVMVRPLSNIPGLIADGTIDHALVICAFWWLTSHRGGSLLP